MKDFVLMKDSLRTPCDDCPFRKENALPGWLGPYNSPEELHSQVMSENPYPCHQTQDMEEPSLCKGALMYMKIHGKQPRNPKHNKMVQQIDVEEARNTVMGYREFCNHHKNKF